MNRLNIKTFIFLDIETTGLPKLENNRTKITELCMVAVEANHIGLGVFPRIQNKLSLCFNPWKFISLESEKMTGLSNGILENQSKFSLETVRTINNFLCHNAKPVCFVAHNGDYFDFPILRREIEKTGSSLEEDVLCIDSLLAFKEIHIGELETNLVESDPTESVDNSSLTIDVTDQVNEEASGFKKICEIQKLNETTPKKQIFEVFPSIPNPAKKMKLAATGKNLNLNVSFKLGDVYRRLTKRQPVKEHEAEGDVIMLITCAATLGDRFVNWANMNAKKFCDIPSMIPGKKIGF